MTKFAVARAACPTAPPALNNWGLAARIGLPLTQQQPLEHPQVIQQPAASVHMPSQPIELVGDELQRLQTPWRGLFARPLGFLRHGFFCRLDRLAQKTDVLE